MPMYATAPHRITPPLGSTEVRVTLESLPVPLRVAASNQSDAGIAMEAELPWLAVGTAVNVELPSGVQQAGRIQSFDMGVTPTGSGRLRIFAELSPGGGEVAGVAAH